MKRDLLDQIVVAIDEQAKRPLFNGKPWPLALMEIAGAWMITVPLIGLIGLLSILVLELDSAALYVIGFVIVVGAEAINRRYRRQAFLEATLAPVLIAGLILGVIPLYLGRPSDQTSGFAAMALIATIVGGVTSIVWLRAPLGAFACYNMFNVWRDYYGYTSDVAFYVLYGSVGIWLAFLWFQEIFLHSSEVAAGAARVEAVSNGWITMVCLTIILSGQTFLISASLPLQSWFAGTFDADEFGQYQFFSPLLSIAAAIWLMRRWPTLRHWRFGLAALAVAVLGVLSSVQGALLLVTAVCLCRGQWRLATLAGIAVIWDIGGVYYQRECSLIWKAAIFSGVGSLLLLCGQPFRHTVRDVLKGKEANKSTTPAISEPRSRLYVAAAMAAIVLTGNALVIQKEYLIAHSDVIFVELAPRDPRSLMSGDYMALSIAVPVLTEAESDGVKRMVLVRQPSGVAAIIGLDRGQSLQANEYSVEINFAQGARTLGSNAWYFTEGDAAKWERARYGEYRIDKHGRVLLVGLRGSDLQKI